MWIHPEPVQMWEHMSYVENVDPLPIPFNEVSLIPEFTKNVPRRHLIKITNSAGDKAASVCCLLYSAGARGARGE
jgi:hypothetical protein